MLRLTSLCRGVSPFTLFLMDQKNNPALKGHAISKRGRILSQMYKELTQRQRRELNQRAARHPSLAKLPKKEKEAALRVARGKRNGEFAKFVKDNYHMVKGLNYRKRFAALSQLYDVSRPIDVEREVAKALPKIKAKEKVKKAVKLHVEEEKIAAAMERETNKNNNNNKKSTSTSNMSKEIKKIAKGLKRQ